MTLSASGPSAIAVPPRPVFTGCDAFYQALLFAVAFAVRVAVATLTIAVAAIGRTIVAALTVPRIALTRVLGVLAIVMVAGIAGCVLITVAVAVVVMAVVATAVVATAVVAATMIAVKPASMRFALCM